MGKVFISHSSKDRDILCLFKDLILKSGIGLTDKEIFYTSSPETGVPIGENIPQYIKENLCDLKGIGIQKEMVYGGSHNGGSHVRTETGIQQRR